MARDPSDGEREMAAALVKAWHKLPGSPDVLFSGSELRAAIAQALANYADAVRREERAAVGEVLMNEAARYRRRNRMILAGAIAGVTAALRARGEG